MSTTPESAANNPSLQSSDTLARARFEGRLPTLLSVIAGMVDLIGFVTLGNIFTAHITGNLVVMAAVLVRGGPLNLAQALAIPVFILAVAAMWLLAKASGRRGPRLAGPLLLVQFLLLAALLAFSVLANPYAEPHGLMAGIAVMVAVSAMACQYSLLRLAMPRVLSTAVMTGNLTNAVLSLLDTLSPQPLTDDAPERLKSSLNLLLGFLVGCIVAAAAVSLLGNWAWSFPVVLAGLAIAFRPRR
jgi:uncharacterized membrane protein YoaK (UPF0700 family)